MSTAKRNPGRAAFTDAEALRALDRTAVERVKNQLATTAKWPFGEPPGDILATNATWFRVSLASSRGKARSLRRSVQPVSSRRAFAAEQQ